jgi:phasin family protein
MAVADKKTPTLAAPAPKAAAASVDQAKTYVDESKSYVDEGAAQGRTVMEKNMEQATKTAETFYRAAEEAAEFGRGNLEAVAKSAQLWTSGMQDLGRAYVSVAQGMADQALEVTKALAAVKSLKEATDLQTAFAKTTFERTLAETAKLHEATFKLAESANAPLTQRMQLAVEKFSRPVAA